MPVIPELEAALRERYLARDRKHDRLVAEAHASRGSRRWSGDR